MGCCGGEREKGPTKQTQKWDFMTLSDFKATSSWTSVAYVWLWFMAIVAVAVYALDTFTAVNLLLFNKWSSSVQPKLAFKYSKWIFAACILLSWTLAIYEWTRAIRTIRRGGVAQSFLDPLAVNLQSMRPQGWRRFLVFTELTKSKKGADYVALFVYFAFKGAIRVVLAEGPRQVVNGLTLYAVMDADIVVHGTPTSNHSAFEQFFLNIGALANENLRQTLVYFSMLFTLIIWVFSALSLAVAAILYITFLWHWIPQRDGRLRTYCKRKVDRRLEKIVEHKIKAAVEAEELQRQKAERKAAQRQKKGDLPPVPGKLTRQPTIPQFDSPVVQQDEKTPEVGLTRQDTNTSLPPYIRSEGGSDEQPTLPDIADDRPSMPGRADTSASGRSYAPSYASEAPLLANAGFAGEEGIPAIPPTAYRPNMNMSHQRPFPQRTMTQNSAFSDGTFAQGPRSFTPYSAVSSHPPPGSFGPLARSNTGFSYDAEPQSAVSAVSSQGGHGFPSDGYKLSDAQRSFRSGPPRQDSYSSRPPVATDAQLDHYTTQRQQSFSRPAQQRQPSLASDQNRRFTSATRSSPAPNSYEMTAQPSYSSQSQPTAASFGGYKAFKPSVPSSSSTAAPSDIDPKITVAGQPGAEENYFGHVSVALQRSDTAPPAEHRLTTGYGDLLDSYGSSSRNSVEDPVEDFSQVPAPSRATASSVPAWQPHQYQR